MDSTARAMAAYYYVLRAERLGIDIETIKEAALNQLSAECSQFVEQAEAFDETHEDTDIKMIIAFALSPECAAAMGAP